MYDTPYYAVIFTSSKNPNAKGYDEMAIQMDKLAADQDGYLGIQSARNDNGLGITVSYWKSLEAIKAWKNQVEHKEAQHKGRSEWYSGYEVRICKVERQYSFGELN